MRKIGLICAALLAGLSLSACNNMASQEMHKNSSSSSSIKVVKHHRQHKKNKEKKKTSSSQVASSSRSTSDTSTQTSKANETTASSTSTNNRPNHVVNDSDGAKDYSNETIRVGENGVTKYDWNGNANDPAQQSSATSTATSLNDAGVIESN